MTLSNPAVTCWLHGLSEVPHFMDWNLGVSLQVHLCCPDTVGSRGSAHFLCSQDGLRAVAQPTFPAIPPAAASSSFLTLA